MVIKFNKSTNLRRDEDGSGFLCADGGFCKLDDISVRVMLAIKNDKKKDDLIDEILMEYSVEKMF